MSNLLFNPNLFFSEKSKMEVNFKYPILIMLVNSVIGIVSIILTMNKIKESLHYGENTFASMLIIGGAIVLGLIITFLNWFITTGIFYCISSLFKSEGSFKRTLEFVGYGYVPKIFSGLVSFFVSYISLSSINNLQNPQAFTENLRQTYLLPEQIIVILCLLLAAYIWIFALLHARNMSIKNAILTVCIPVSLYLIYLICLLYFLISHPLNA